jgi:hypothetical protein
VLDWAESSAASAVGPSVLKAAVLKVDPHTPQEVLREMLVRVFGDAGAAAAAAHAAASGAAATTAPGE